MKKTALSLALALGAVMAHAAPATYTIDPSHTFPSFEADHMGGLSKWRGVFKKTAGTIVMDGVAQTGTVDIVVDTNSIEFGHDKLNEHAKGADLFDTAKFPTAMYKGTLAGFVNGAPTRVDGTFTLKGVSQPLSLQINSFKCMQHPMLKREVCGADANATFMRDAYGMDMGKNFGFKMDVTLRIQVEALRAQ